MGLIMYEIVIWWYRREIKVCKKREDELTLSKWRACLLVQKLNWQVYLWLQATPELSLVSSKVLSKEQSHCFFQAIKSLEQPITLNEICFCFCTALKSEVTMMKFTAKSRKVVKIPLLCIEMWCKSKLQDNMRTGWPAVKMVEQKN